MPKRRHAKNWSRPLKRRPAHLAAIRSNTGQFSGTTYTVHISQFYQRVALGVYETYEKAVMARRLALYWKEKGYDLTEGYV